MDDFDFDKLIESKLEELCIEDHEGIPQWLVEKKKIRHLLSCRFL